MIRLKINKVELYKFESFTRANSSVELDCVHDRHISTQNVLLALD